MEIKKSFLDFIVESTVVTYNLNFTSLNLRLSEIRSMLNRLANLVENSRIKDQLITTLKAITQAWSKWRDFETKYTSIFLCLLQAWVRIPYAIIFFTFIG